MTPAPDPDDALDPEVLRALAARSAPPNALRARILAAAAGKPFAFVMHDEGTWLPSRSAPVATKLLLADSGDCITTRLVRVARGETLPDAPLRGRRSLFVIEGRLSTDGVRPPLAAGDFVDEGSALEWRAESSAEVVEFCQAASEGPAVRHARDEVARLSVARHSIAHWVDAMPGGRVRPLAGSSREGRSFMVLSMEPEAVLAEHVHDGREELLVLSGHCVVEGRQLAVGDYHRAASRSLHGDARSLEQGCVLLVALRDPVRLGAAAGGR